MKRHLLIIFLSSFSAMCLAQRIEVYPSPAVNFGKISDKYLVTVTQNGISKKTVVYKTTAGNGTRNEWGIEQNNNFHFVTFSFSGSVTVHVTKLNSSAGSAIVRPNRLGIGSINSVNNSANETVTFRLTKSAKVSVEFSDDPDYKDPLMIFADVLENRAAVPSLKDDNVMVVTNSSDLNNIPGNKTVVYFPPGVYTIGHWNIAPHINHVYIAGGAYVKGYLSWKVAKNAPGIEINGRGILSNDGYPFHYPGTPTDLHSSAYYFPIRMSGGVNNVIEGITIIESTSFEIGVSADNVLIQNVKINGFRLTNDALTLSGSGYKINDCFLRVNDDTIVLYASDVTVTNCVFWHLHAGAIFELGWTPHSMTNINISNCDIIHDQSSRTDDNVGFINAMNATLANQTSAINNVNVTNIYFDTPIIRFLDIRGDRRNSTSFKSPLNQAAWVYKDFHFANIFFNQAASNKYPLIYLHGYDDDHPLTNFTFENVYFHNMKTRSKDVDDSLLINKKKVFGIEIK